MINLLNGGCDYSDCWKLNAHPRALKACIEAFEDSESSAPRDFTRCQRALRRRLNDENAETSLS